MRLGITKESFGLATPEDRPEILRVLRENPMEGLVELSFERSPDPEASVGNQWPSFHATIVGRRPGGGLFGVGTLGVRDCWLSGVSVPTGYLGTLRLDRDARNHPRLLLHAFECLRQVLETQSPARFTFTSIVNDNLRARAVLEAGLPGMPGYRPIAGMDTLAMRTQKAGWFSRKQTEDAGPDMLGDIARLLEESGRTTDFAPVWTAQMLTDHAKWQGPSPEDFCVVMQSGRIVGCAALWDQRPFSQIVIRGISGVAGKVIGALLGAGPMNGMVLPMAFVSHLAAREDDPEVTRKLITGLSRKAKARGIDFLSLGMPSHDPRAPMMAKAFAGKVIQSTIYAVCWPKQEAVFNALGGGNIYPEVALL